MLAATGPPGQVATLILPADVSWTEGAEALPPSVRTAPPQPDLTAAVEAIARALRNGHHAHPAHSLQAEDVDDVPVPTHDEREPAPREGVRQMPQTRRRRATVIDLSGAATSRTPFG